MAGLRGLFQRGQKAAHPPVAVATPSVQSAQQKKQPKRLSVALRTIICPLVTEKTARLGTEGSPSATFRVLTAATKSDVKRAVQELYGTRVLSVQILNTPDRQMRSRFGAGRTKRGYKKAVVRFVAGSQVDVTKFPATNQ